MLFAQIADTVVVRPNGQTPENMCNAATKAWDKVSYILNDDQEVSGPQQSVSSSCVLQVLPLSCQACTTVHVHKVS